ncbi:maestro heat-like repeat-containing protein family member 2B isoform X2 [Mauremys reevesii]|nr:maestro heat-like repeat-containing protein family member 2B isoform X2 [Mauremys reevesii]
MARVVSEYFPPEQATAFIEATVESMLSASPTCATAAGLWMKVILKECGDAMLDKVPAIVDIIYSHMATIQEGSLRQFLLEAVSILAHHHLEAVISSLLSNHLPMDRQHVPSLRWCQHSSRAKLCRSCSQSCFLFSCSRSAEPQDKRCLCQG